MTSPPETSIELPATRARGTPCAIGRFLGKEQAAPIAAFVQQRLLRLNKQLGRAADAPASPVARDFAAACLERLRSWDAHGADEHEATATAAGLDARDLYLAANLTDMRDALRSAGQPSPSPDAEGCSAMLVSGACTQDGNLLGAQTWDLAPGDVRFVCAVHRSYPQAPSWWTVSCTGCPTLLFVNEAGVTGGTTNLRTTATGVGVGYLSVLHRLARIECVEDGVALLRETPFVGAHTYWLADRTGACLVLADARRCRIERLEASPVVQTNHPRAGVPVADCLETPARSSCCRLNRLQQLLSAPPVDPDGLLRCLADRNDGIDSVNRYPEDGTNTATNACWIGMPHDARAWACRGPADRGVWVVLDPEQATCTPRTRQQP